MPMVVPVARVFRRGIFQGIGIQTLVPVRPGRAAISARPGKRKTLHLRGFQQSRLKSKIHDRKYRQALYRSPREDKAD
jgi:hypothetical protein